MVRHLSAIAVARIKTASKCVTSEIRPTRTQSVQDRIVSETHLSRCLETGFWEVGTPIQARRVLRWRLRGGAVHDTFFPFFYNEEAGAKGPPLSPAPPIPAEPPPLRSGQFRLTIPNTYSKITMSASLRSDCCSPSLRNAVRLPSGIDVHLHRNSHSERGNQVRDDTFFMIVRGSHLDRLF